ncbi:MAG: hypothetical protein Ta2E_08960 [Mycoplasmoidaceae bacterium]|nr:MAG: hypothetical protein Ta2E_08960 [Mycoplasmoidaceae bacterium]
MSMQSVYMCDREEIGLGDYEDRGGESMETAE